MTQDRDFKRLVRERMRATGQTYTQARAQLRPDPRRAEIPPLESAPPPQAQIPREPGERAPSGQPAPADPDRLRARREYETVLGRFITDGRLVRLPARRRARVCILLHLVARFAPDITYAEPEVNAIVGAVVDDHAFWRRELVNYGYLERAGGRYWLTPRMPERSAQISQEIPDWERLWLPGHLAGGER